jgi:hypothetical protein
VALDAAALVDLEVAVDVVGEARTSLATELLAAAGRAEASGPSVALGDELKCGVLVLLLGALIRPVLAGVCKKMLDSYEEALGLVVALMASLQAVALRRTSSERRRSPRRSPRQS